MVDYSPLTRVNYSGLLNQKSAIADAPDNFMNYYEMGRKLKSRNLAKGVTNIEDDGSLSLNVEQARKLNEHAPEVGRKYQQMFLDGKRQKADQMRKEQENLFQGKMRALKLEKAKREIEKMNEPEPQFNFGDEQKLRREFEGRKGVSAFRKVNDSWGRVQASKETAAGDLALIFNYMKMLDPGSTVREGEFATAQNAAGVPERIRSQYQRLIDGERLTPSQRADFIGQARSLFDAQANTYNDVANQYRGLAGEYNLNPDRIATVYDLAQKGDPEAAEIVERIEESLPQQGFPEPEKPEYSLEDLEFTAKEHGMTVEQVKQELEKSNAR